MLEFGNVKLEVIIPYKSNMAAIKPRNKHTKWELVIP